MNYHSIKAFIETFFGFEISEILAKYGISLDSV